MRILFVRHGRSIANANGTIGTPTTPLAEEGIDQARQTGRDLRGEDVTRIVCSPYIRAQQTAEFIADELSIPLDKIRIVQELSERSMGVLEGRPKQHESEYFYDNDIENDFESKSDLIVRMRNALAKIKKIAKETDGTTLVVGHATSGFYLLQIAKGKRSFNEFEPISQMSNAEFIELSLGK